MSKQLELAIGELQQTTYLDPRTSSPPPSSRRPHRMAEGAQRRRQQVRHGGVKDKAKNDRGRAEAQPGGASNIPIILKFQQTEIARSTRALSKASGINFLYDPSSPEEKIDIDLTTCPSETR